MLIYRTVRRPEATRTLWRSFRVAADRAEKGSRGHGEIRDLLVAFDEIESAVIDALHPEFDAEGDIECFFRQAALELGRIFLHSWEGRPREVRSGLRRLAERLEGIGRLELPATVFAAEAEGYAWYGLYPETYVASAQRFCAQVRPRAAVCIGLRQIGASLSAVVAAALSEGGCLVRLHTVRPRGHPFARVFRPDPALAARFRSWAESAHFLLIDEGPGLSGSSLSCIAEALSSWGIPDERIVFFPSRPSDGSGFVSVSAGRRWRRHRQFTTAPEEIGLPLEELSRAFPGRTFLDLSAGLWRPLLLRRPEDFPPVQPQHERRKYLAMKRDGEFSSGLLQGKDGSMVLARFSRFGRGGQRTLERGCRLAECGFGPPVLGAENGFLFTRFVPGRPLMRGACGRGFLETAAGYLSCLRREFPAAEGTSPEVLLEMVRINVAEGLGPRWAERLDAGIRRLPKGLATAMDGRMFPHEWLTTRTGYLKTDGFDHHGDHFMPGATDIAWDLAATICEFRLSPSQAGYFLRRYAELSGDRRIACRLPFYGIAYGAFRLGYARMAAANLGDCEDGRRFRRAAHRYGRDLVRRIRAARDSSDEPRLSTWNA